jgi:hypothetical protein
MYSNPTPIHPVITIDSFTKWGMDFMDFNTTLTRGHHQIIVAMDYFTKWFEAMPTIKYDGETAAHFIYNHILSLFGILKNMFTDHGSHFHNKMMTELESKLGFKQDHSSSYYPHENGQVEALNKSLKSILKKKVRQSKSKYLVMLYPSLWEY